MFYAIWAYLFDFASSTKQKLRRHSLKNSLYYRAQRKFDFGRLFLLHAKEIKSESNCGQVWG